MTALDKDAIKKNRLLIISAVVLFVVFVLLAITTILSIGKFGASSKPADESEIIKNGAGGSEDTSPQGKEDTRRESLVGNLIDKTPYNSKDFSFSYSYEKGEFVLYILPGHEQAGNQEFDQFLKQNGVESRDWIRHLTIVSVKPTQ